MEWVAGRGQRPGGLELGPGVGGGIVGPGVVETAPASTGPPNMISRRVTGSYAIEWAERAGGSVPEGLSSVQALATGS